MSGESRCIRASARRARAAQGSLDNINLFSLITVLSFFLLAPFTLLREGFVFRESAMRGMGILAPETVIRQALLAGVCFHAYQQVTRVRVAVAGPPQARRRRGVQQHEHHLYAGLPARWEQGSLFYPC